MNMIASPDGEFALVSDIGTHQALWSIRTSEGTGVSHMDFPNAKPNKVCNGLYLRSGSVARTTRCTPHKETTTASSPCHCQPKVG